MCGILGLFDDQPVAGALQEGLLMLQHRGQDAAGIMTCDEGNFFLRKSNGLVRDVFRPRHLSRLLGTMGIAHVRYPTAGSSEIAEAQPFYVNSPYGIALAHNGNLTNANELREVLFREDRRHLNTYSDSEVLLNVMAHELQSINQLTLSSEDIFHAMANVYQRCRGGYAAVALLNGHGLLAFRDPHGIRPLVYGVKKTASGKTSYLFASESVALDLLGYTLVDDVAPGEVVYIDLDGQLHKKRCAEVKEYTPCIFEYVYFARPDSLVNQISVYQARLNMGTALAKTVVSQLDPKEIDVVVPIPDSSRHSAFSLAQALSLPYREGFVKNHYVGRTFIMPAQTQRRHSVRRKLNAIPAEFKDKTVLLVDDSIVRGTTSREIVQMAREAGAKRVLFASAAPQVQFPNVYGIDMPVAEELVAHEKSIQEICEEIGADALFYQTLSDLKEAVSSCAASDHAFECAVFDGQYVTQDVNEAYFTSLSQARSNQSKEKEQLNELKQL